MGYTKRQLAYVLYNNRSVEGVVESFLERGRFDPRRLVEIEEALAWCDSRYAEEKTVAVAADDFDVSAADVVYGPSQVEVLGRDVMHSHIELIYPTHEDSQAERDWLTSRGVTDRMVMAMCLGSLSHFVRIRPDGLEALGVTVHPALKGILEDDMSRGILFPLYDVDTLLNCTTRRLSDVGKLKYVQACPDINVWFFGVNGRLDGEVWLAEGILDAGAIYANGKASASVSSAMWSGPQLYRLLDAVRVVNIFADNDRVGLRTAMVLKRFFGMMGVPCETWVSRLAKDPAEHFLERGLGWDDVERVEITREMVGSAPDMTFNFMDHLRGRKF